MAFEPIYGRLEAMKAVLLWEGRLKRSRLMSLFGIKQTRASQWINEFGDVHPGWMRWSDQTMAHHVTGKAFRDSASTPRLAGESTPSLDLYLSITNSPISANLEREDGIIWSAFPDFSAPKPEFFSTLYGAIAEASQVEAQYRSLSHPEPHTRILSPHSIIRAGRRWHARAYCEAAEAFRDFTLGRFINLKPLGRSRVKCAEDDHAWMTRVRVEIVAHPGLTESQQRMIRDEYFNGFASRIEYCRGCLVPYLIQDLHATLHPERELAPAWLLAVANPKEVRPWLIP